LRARPPTRSPPVGRSRAEFLCFLKGRRFGPPPTWGSAGVGIPASAPSSRRSGSRFLWFPQPRIVGRVGAVVSVVGTAILASMVSSIGTDGLASIVVSGRVRVTATTDDTTTVEVMTTTASVILVVAAAVLIGLGVVAATASVSAYRRRSVSACNAR